MHNTSLEQELRRIEESHLRPEVRHSAAAMADLLADDFVEFGSSGTIYTDKQKIIESLQDSPPLRASLSDFQAKLLGPDVALTTYRLVKHNESRPHMKHSLRSSVWKLMDGRWQLVFHQGTPTAVPDE